MSVLVLDGYNMIHRCRFDWGQKGVTPLGESKVIYNFFRLLRSTVDSFPCNKVYFVIEGVPSHRLAIDTEYKANRVKKDLSPEEVEYWDSFSSQKNFIISLMKDCFPIEVVRHPMYEADDVIYTLIKSIHPDEDLVVVSSDTDFIQILNEFPDRVQVWNPLAKNYRENTPYDYVSWKSMVGDRTDNIQGVPRVGKKTASKILNSPGELASRLKDPDFKRSYDTSYELIKLKNVPHSELCFSGSNTEWEVVKKSFNDLSFKFSFDETSWEEYQNTFDCLGII